MSQENVGAQFHQYKRTTYRLEPDPRWNRTVNAVQDNTNKLVGVLGWKGPEARLGLRPQEENAVAHVDVLARHRGRGIADAMLKYAKGINPDLHHSDTLTDSGKEWAAKHPI